MNKATFEAVRLLILTEYNRRAQLRRPNFQNHQYWSDGNKYVKRGANIADYSFMLNPWGDITFIALRPLISS